MCFADKRTEKDDIRFRLPSASPVVSLRHIVSFSRKTATSSFGDALRNVSFCSPVHPCAESNVACVFIELLKDKISARNRLGALFTRFPRGGVRLQYPFVVADKMTAIDATLEHMPVPVRDSV